MKYKTKIQMLLSEKVEQQEAGMFNLKSVKQNTLFERIKRLYSDKQELVQDLHLFVNSKDIDFKLKLIFKIYDSDNDGLITKVDLYSILKDFSEC